MYILSIDLHGYKEYYTHLSKDELTVAQFEYTNAMEITISKSNKGNSLEIAKSIIKFGQDNWHNFEDHFAIVTKTCDHTDSDFNNALIDLHELGVKFNPEKGFIEITDYELVKHESVLFLVDYYGFNIIIPATEEYNSHYEMTIQI